MKNTARRAVTIAAVAALPLFAASGVAEAQTDTEAPALGSIPSEVTGPLMPVLAPLAQSVGQPLVLSGVLLFGSYCTIAEISNPFACA